MIKFQAARRLLNMFLAMDVKVDCKSGNPYHDDKSGQFTSKNGSTESREQKKTQKEKRPSLGKGLESRSKRAENKSFNAEKHRRRTKSIRLTKEEYAVVVHAINDLYHSVFSKNKSTLKRIYTPLGTFVFKVKSFNNYKFYDKIDSDDDIVEADEG